MSFIKALKCRECAKEYPKTALHVCEYCFGPLEVAYEYEKDKKGPYKRGDRKAPGQHVEIQGASSGGGGADSGAQVGFTPLIKASNLADALGVKELYLKNDAVNYPTLSFKDRVVSVAISRARELGFKVVSCASTGNLANSVAANAASCGMESFVFIPFDLEQTKILGTLVYGSKVIGIRGTYDEVNRLCPR